MIYQFNFYLTSVVVVEIIDDEYDLFCGLQVDWLYCSLLHGGPGPGLQLPGFAVWYTGIW